MLTRHLTYEECFSMTHDRERANFLMERLNRIVDTEGKISFSDVKAYYYDLDDFKRG